MGTLLAHSLLIRICTTLILRIRYKCRELYRVNNRGNGVIEISSPDFHLLTAKYSILITVHITDNMLPVISEKEKGKVLENNQIDKS